MMILFAMVLFSLLGCYRLRRKSFSRGGSFVKYDAAFKWKNREAEPLGDEPSNRLEIFSSARSGAAIRIIRPLGALWRVS
jgi:hypothetical protein